uniref:Uncharacterized protein n=1 Tax=Acrobeloides nanus TaxID=290746 RepID=A0A914EHJ9_9BILA
MKTLQQNLQYLLQELPPIDFDIFGDNQKLLNAVFCGNYQDTMSHNTGTSSSVKPNVLLENLQQQIINFIRKLTPRTTDHQGVRYCGNISVFDVTPNVSSVRNLVEKLNNPLRLANFFSDNIKDYNQIADSLQDAIASSDLAKAANYLSTMVNQTKYGRYLDLFHNSSDPNSLLELIKAVTENFENVSDCVRFDRFVMTSDENEMENLAVCLSDYQQYFTGIVFPNFTGFDYEIGPFTTYKIRHNPSIVDFTYAIMDNKKRTASRDDPIINLHYIMFGFSFLQEAIDKHLIEMITNESIPQHGVYAQQEPYPCQNSD